MTDDFGIQFRAAAEAALDAIIAADERGAITYWNRAAERMFGYSSTEMLGGSLTRIMPERFRELHKTGIRRLVTTGEAHVVGSTVELVGLRHDGTEFPIELSLGMWNTGTSKAFTGVIRDITTRHQAEASLKAALQIAEEANRLKSEFLTRMSHELRTPLNSIIGFSKVLQKNKRSALDVTELSYLERIHRNGRHLLALINDILDWSKIETGSTGDVVLTPVDLGALVRDVIAESTVLVQDKRITLQADIPSPIDTLNTDATKLYQILLNLVENAIKFTTNGTVTVRVATEQNSSRPIRIDVVDSGIGIRPDQYEQLFKPFEQGEEDSTTRRYGGTGLGLAVTRAFCEILGYSITIDSVLNAGSTFSVILQATETH